MRSCYVNADFSVTSLRFCYDLIHVCHVEDRIKSSIRPSSANYVLSSSAAGFHWVFTTPRQFESPHRLRSLHCLQQWKADFVVLWLRAQNLGGPQPRVEQSTTYRV